MTERTPAGPDTLALQADLVSHFADDVAHEMRNPLNALVINLEVLRRRVMNGDSEAALGRITVIESEVRRVHTTIERFVALLRPPAVEEPTCDVSAALDAIVPLLALRAAALRCTFEPPGRIDVDVRLSIDRLRFVVLDGGMSGFDRAGRDGHLSCIATCDAGICRVLFRGGPKDVGPAAIREGDLRLARAILGPAGGRVEVRAGEDGGFEIELDVPTVA